jgi:hypothetical protein
MGKKREMKKRRKMVRVRRLQTSFPTTITSSSW